ncbi:hypothetical protein NA57DRAFT_71649 [Rhizodiscina lignyota]|uniref:Nucleotide-sugar transporter n=1 Tax=Rhizodiscina lignyota TaxID=1504668 RepID=A0A9P4INU9_9PEZI|nr:hypothetical protein NA57DRAFT_71649 [Rhizodiscina lignyota]
MRTSVSLLSAFVCFETVRALLLYGAVQSGLKISPTAVTFWAEFLKLSVSTLFLCRQIRKDGRSLTFKAFFEAAQLADAENPNASAFKLYASYALPAALYFINNILYLTGLQVTSPSLLHVTILAKLPLTAILHHYLIRSQKNGKAWISLGVLCVGLLIFQIPQSVKNWMWSFITAVGVVSTDKPRENGPSNEVLGLLIGSTIAVISAFTSTYTETILKRSTNFWTAQVWLYLYGSLFAFISAFFWDGRVKHDKDGNENASKIASASITMLVSAVASIVTAATGLVVANILKKKDNLVRLVGVAAAIVSIALWQGLLFADLRSKTINVFTVLGLGTISIATWTYNYYKDQQPGNGAAYTPVENGINLDGDEDEDNKPDAGNASGTADQDKTPSYLVPTWPRLIGATVVVLLLTALSAMFQPSSSEK